MRLHPDGSTVWVTGETDHNVTILDTEDGQGRSAQIEVGKRPRSLAFTPDGKRAYVTSEVDGTVWVIDVAGAEEAQGHHHAQGLQADGRRSRRRTGSGLRLQRPRRDGLGHRSGDRLGRRHSRGGDSGPGASRSRPTARKLYTANGPSNDVTRGGCRRAHGHQEDSGRARSPWGVAIGQAARDRDVCAVLALVAAVALAGSARAGPSALPDRARRPGRRCTRSGARASAAKVERVACLAERHRWRHLRITRILPLDRRRRLARRVGARASLETCGPPDWQGTVHTHIALCDGRPALLLVLRRRPGRDADVVAALEGGRHVLPALQPRRGPLRDRRRRGA